MNSEQLRGLTHRQRGELVVVEPVEPRRTRLLRRHDSQLVRAVHSVPASVSALLVMLNRPVRRLWEGRVARRLPVVSARHPAPVCR